MGINIWLQIWGKDKALQISQKYNENEGDWQI